MPRSPLASVGLKIDGGPLQEQIRRWQAQYRQVDDARIEALHRQMGEAAMLAIVEALIAGIDSRPGGPRVQRDSAYLINALEAKANVKATANGFGVLNPNSMSHSKAAIYWRRIDQGWTSYRATGPLFFTDVNFGFAGEVPVEDRIAPSPGGGVNTRMVQTVGGKPFFIRPFKGYHYTTTGWDNYTTDDLASVRAVYNNAFQGLAGWKGL